MNGQRYGKLKITLKSELCAGSGYSYAGIVDSDTAYDDCGLPYIPARRLKGCMREAAETLLYGMYSEQDIIRVFGEKGSEYGSDFLIDNAYIEDADGIREFLGKDSGVKTQEVLDRFTHIIGQTRMENGVADKGSLRYTRVVNHYSPIDHKEMVFSSDFSCRREDWDMIQHAARSTRHIGLKRNRGLGNVRIDVMEAEKQEGEKTSLIQRVDLADGRTVLRYAVKNVQPLMLSNLLEDESADYISGQQVLGLLAGKYLKDAGNAAEDTAFQTLFLNGSATFSNLYPYDGKHIHYPAPDYLNRLKKTKKLVYNIASELPKKNELSNAEDYWYEEGNQPKKLKGKFTAWTPQGISVLEVKKDVLYHHSHRNTHETENGKEEGILYSMEVIRRGQQFAGFISVPKEYVDLVIKLLCEGDLYFGKSRTAQYGKCHLVRYEEENNGAKKTFGAGKDIVVTFLSDALLHDATGKPAVFYEDVREAVIMELGIPTDCVERNLLSSVQSTVATGYLSVWNLRKPVVPAVKSGSYLVYHLLDNFSTEKKCVGERTLEGYGQIRIDDAASCKYDGVKEVAESTLGNPGTCFDGKLKCKADALRIPIIYDRWLDRRINAAINGKEKVNVSNTAAGRFVLMLRESIAESADKRKAFSKFGERIDSFKTGNTRDEGRKILTRIGHKGKDDSTERNTWDVTADAQYFECDSDLQRDLELIGVQDSLQEKIERWPDYVMAVLTDRKYKGRKE